MGSFDGILVKYGSVIMSYIVLVIPVFREQRLKQYAEKDRGKLMKFFTINRKYITNLSKALGRLVLTYK